MTIFARTALWQKDKEHFLHPWTHFDTFKRDGSLVIREAKGAYVTDASGRRYLDGIGGLWCVNIGYGREEMAQVIAEQVLQARAIRTPSPIAPTNRPRSSRPSSPSSPRERSTTSPIRCRARARTTRRSASPITITRAAANPNRRVILSRYNSYHGSTYLGMTLGNREGDRSPHFRYIDGLVHHLSAPVRLSAPRRHERSAVHGSSRGRSCEAAIRDIGAANIAAFIAEPIQGAGGVVPPPPAICRACARSWRSTEFCSSRTRW